jgi:hypothetical protein
MYVFCVTFFLFLLSFLLSFFSVLRIEPQDIHTSPALLFCLVFFFFLR